MISLVGLLVTDAYQQIKDSAAGPSLSAVVVPLDDCPTYLFPGNHVPRLPRYDELGTRWTYDHGGFAASGGPVQVVLQGESDDVVVLLGMTIRVLSRQPAHDLVAVRKCAGAGDLYPRFFRIDLDEGGFPSAQPVAGDREIPGDGGIPAMNFPYTVSRSEVEVVWLIPQTSACICTWEATVQWSSGGEEGTTRLRFDSRPFKTAATTGEEHRFDFFPDGRLTAVEDG